LQVIACGFTGDVIKQANGDIDMKLNHIDGQRAYRSYKHIEGHRQLKALWVLQKQILQTADRIKTSRILLAKYPGNASDREMWLRHVGTLRVLLSIKRELRGL
jgi:hypothetical protein